MASNQSLNRLVEHCVREAGLPGVAAAIVEGATVSWTRAAGFADLERLSPIRTDTVVRAGSISKTLTAIGVLQLWEEGRFELDEPINRHLRAFPVHHRGGPPVTIRHLLTHTAGIGPLRSIGDMFRPYGALGVREGKTIPPLREYYADGLLPEVRAGVKFAYVNHGYAALGQLVEDLSGEPFAVYMRRRVFAPLRMESSDFERTPTLAARLARGYQAGSGRPRPVRPLDVIVAPAVSLLSTLDDLARYAAALLNGGEGEAGRILRAETVRMMLEPHYRLDPRLPGMGLGFVLGREGRHRVAGHDGGWAGFTSSLLLAPDDGVAVIAVANGLDLAVPRLGVGLLREALDTPEPSWALGVPARVSPDRFQDGLVGAYQPRRGFFTNMGIYRWTGLGGQVDIVQRGGSLVLRTPAGPLRRGTRLYASEDGDRHVYRYEHEDQVHTLVFQRGPDGVIDRVCIGMDVFTRRPAARSLAGRARLRLLALIDQAVERAVLLVFKVRIRPAPAGRPD